MTDKGTYSQLRELRVLIAQQGFQLQLAGRRELHDSRYWLTVRAKQARLGTPPDDVSELFPVSVRLQRRSYHFLLRRLLLLIIGYLCKNSCPFEKTMRLGSRRHH
jgi:hypothetical protein